MKLEIFYKDQQRIGRLVDDPSNGLIYFQYNQEWLNSRLELSPFHLPLAGGTTIQAHHEATFNGLHGLFWDSLPDAWGRAVLQERLFAKGIDIDQLSPLLQLSYLGSRGMGALSYVPDADSAQEKIVEAVSLAAIDREASYILEGKPIKGKSEEILALFQAGFSAGGAKPKILASLQGNDLHISPHVASNSEGWIIKLSNVPVGHKDSKQEGRMEYSYSLMARAAGIEMPSTRLFEIDTSKKNHAGKRGLFGVRRFDRIGSEKVHIHSLAGLLQKNFHALEISYEELISTTLELTGDFRQAEQVLRRLVFNVASANCDDHAKNHCFMMDASGKWSLAPAFDLTLSAGMNKTNLHAMRVNGTRTPRLKDLQIFAEQFGFSSLDKILHDVITSIERWSTWAEQAGCRTANIQKGNLRLDAALLLLR